MQALARRYINLGHNTKYYHRVSTLLEEIKAARLDGSYTKTLSQRSQSLNCCFLMYPKGISFEHFGITPLKGDEINDLFEVIEEKMFNGSIIITAQLPVKDWHAYLRNETIADAMMDRLVHTAHKIGLSGPSMREILAKS